MRGREAPEISLPQTIPHPPVDPSSVGLSPATFSRKGRRAFEGRF
jgi:hypothetical protein